MRVRPVLFSDAMVRALLEGRKTQTRRVLLPQPDLSYIVPLDEPGWFGGEEGEVRFQTKHVPGDLLYCREAWRCNGWATDLATVFYRASEGDGYTAMCEQFPVEGKKRLRVDPRWHPSIHQPRWASRLTLDVSEVRVQRLQDISENDAINEGIKPQHVLSAHEGAGVLAWGYDGLDGFGEPTATLAFRRLWNSLNAKRGHAWETNPWVTATTFNVHKKNVDAFLQARTT